MSYSAVADLSVRRRAGYFLLRRVGEIAQIGRLLALAARHQIAFRTQEVALAADLDMAIALGAVFLGPHQLFFRVAAIALGDGPGPCQRGVDGRDLVEHHVWIG